MSSPVHKVYVTALQIEAKPLIDLLGLKAVEARAGLRRWVGDGATLVVTGTGKVASAIGTAVALREAAGNGRLLAVNFGLCGSVDPAVDIGTVVLANRVCDVGAGRDWYPEMLVRHNLREGALATHDQVVTEPEQAVADFVDMEAAGFMAAALPLVGAAGAIVCKVVSDHLACTRLMKEQIVDALHAATPVAVAHAAAVDRVLPDEVDVLGHEIRELLNVLNQQWQLSVTRGHQLRKAVLAYCVRKGAPPIGTLTAAAAVEIETREIVVEAFDALLGQLDGE